MLVPYLPLIAGLFLGEVFSYSQQDLQLQTAPSVSPKGKDL